MEHDDDDDCIVVDNGSWMIKAGYSSGKTARVYEKTVVGRKISESSDKTDIHIGDRACYPPECQLSWPIERGAVVDWDEMEMVWDFIFRKELKDTVNNNPMLITEVPGNHHSNRDKMVEILFEKYNVSSLYMIEPGSLSLISSGRITGIVLDIGGTTTHVSALHEGKDLLHTQDTEDVSEMYDRSKYRLDIGGNDITRYLQNWIDHKYHTICNTWSHDKLFQNAELLKHHLLSWQPDNEQNTFLFSDGTELPLDKELLTCFDVLFDPKLVGLDLPGVDVMLTDVLSSFDDDIKKQLYSNVILSGGATLCPGITDGITDKITSSLKARAAGLDGTVKVICPPERRKSSWLGGSIIGSLEVFPSLCKSRQCYFDRGVHQFHSFPGLECLKKLS